MTQKYELYNQAGQLVESRDYTAAEIEAVNRAELKALDQEMPPIVEDIFDVLTASQKNAMPQAVRDKIQRRKDLRAALSTP